MKSIRWSLMIYFVALLVVALGVVAGLVYRNSLVSLEASQKSRSDLLAARTQDLCKEAQAVLDARLLRQAHILANLAKIQFGPRSAAVALGLLAASSNPQGPLTLLLGMREGISGQLCFRLNRGPDIAIAEAVAHHEDESRDEFFFQTYSEAGKPLQRSRSLGDRSWTLDPSVMEQVGRLEWCYDDSQWLPGVGLRRVTLRAPVMHFVTRSVGTVRRRPPQRPLGPPPPSDLPSRANIDRVVPAIFIQYGSTTRLLEQQLAGYRKDLENEQEAVRAETRERLATLRRQLLWLGLATLAATIVGCFWLISVGLAPLRRLSEAVSRVSARDFRLPVEAGHLPVELRPIQERLRQTLDMLQKAFDREKQAAADISHELRTPLAALMTTVEVGLRKVRTPEHYDELLRECRSVGQHMTQLVEQLLVLARLDAGRGAVRPQDVNVTKLTEQCTDLVRPLADSRGLTLDVHCPGPVHLRTDPDKLREVLTNLLHNAIEYNRPQGRVDVHVERTNGILRLAVTDTGIGIAEPARDHLFERFFRVDDSRHADGLHAGLGLAIVKGYVELLGGTVAVESVEGKGSTFRVDLPFPSAPAGRRDHGHAPLAGD
jgi:heavy metal sensor kinase